jgi:hypothetical protein
MLTKISLSRTGSTTLYVIRHETIYKVTLLQLIFCIESIKNFREQLNTLEYENNESKNYLHCILKTF